MDNNLATNINNNKDMDSIRQEEEEATSLLLQDIKVKGEEEVSREDKTLYMRINSRLRT